jgi:hypothetical protein
VRASHLSEYLHQSPTTALIGKALGNTHKQYRPGNTACHSCFLSPRTRQRGWAIGAQALHHLQTSPSRTKPPTHNPALNLPSRRRRRGLRNGCPPSRLARRHAIAPRPSWRASASRNGAAATVVGCAAACGYE